MKFALVVIGLAVMLAGVQVGCGPEEKYCYEQHTTCRQALIDKMAKDKEEQDRIDREKDAMGGIGDGGATVIGQ